MRRGCISLGDIKCDGCGQTVPHSQRYLIIDKDDGTSQQLCVDCGQKKGYVHYKEDKGEQVMSFFPEELEGGA